MLVMTVISGQSLAERDQDVKTVARTPELHSNPVKPPHRQPAWVRGPVSCMNDGERIDK